MKKLAILATLILFATPAQADTRILNQDIHGGTLGLDDASQIVSTRLTDVHVILFTADRGAFIGVQFEGNTWLTIDGKDYKTVGQITQAMDDLMGNHNYNIVNCIWEKDGKVLSFGRKL